MGITMISVEVGVVTSDRAAFVTLTCLPCGPNVMRSYTAPLDKDGAVARAVRNAVDHAHVDHGAVPSEDPPPTEATPPTEGERGRHRPSHAGADVSRETSGPRHRARARDGRAGAS